jgi:hypothetical protein
MTINPDLANDFAHLKAARVITFLSEKTLERLQL